MNHGSLLKTAQAVKARLGRRFIGIVLATLALIGFGRPALARSLALATVLEPNTSLSVTCPTRFTVKLSKDKKTVTLKCAPLSTPTATLTPRASATPSPVKSATPTVVPPSPTPTHEQVLPTLTPSPSAVAPMPTATPGGNQSPYTGEQTPDGKPVCAKWVHDQYATTMPDGMILQTWHPQIDPTYGCVFGHEHGSDPRQFVGFNHSGIPVFGGAAHTSGDMAEISAHAGFKVFVINDDGRGKAWMMVLHQGTGSPRRFSVRFHSLEIWMTRRSDNALLAHVNVMADFGAFVPNCPGAAFQRAMILGPQVGCDSPYEEWDAALNVGGFFLGNPAVALDNATTRFNPDDPTGIYPNLPAACGPSDPFGWDSYCKGDKRSFFHPRWALRNTGPADVFYTNAYGELGSGPGPGMIEQYVRRNVVIDESGECCGPTVVYLMQDPATGVYIRQDRSAEPFQTLNFEYPGYTLRPPN